MHCWQRVWEWRPRKSETSETKEGVVYMLYCLTYRSTQVRQVYTTQGRMSTEWVSCLRDKQYMVRDSRNIHTILPPDLIMPWLSVHPPVNKQEEHYSSLLPVLLVWNSAVKIQVWQWERNKLEKKTISAETNVERWEGSHWRVKHFIFTICFFFFLFGIFCFPVILLFLFVGLFLLKGTGWITET